MTIIGARMRAYAGRPLPSRELRRLPGFLVAWLLRVGDIPRLLLAAAKVGESGSETVAGRTFSRKPVRRRLRSLVGCDGRAPESDKRVRAIVRIPEYATMGRAFFGMHENYYDPAEIETLALLGLWTGEGTTPRPGSRTIRTSHHPRSDTVKVLLAWQVLDDTWSVEQLELLDTLLRDGIEHDRAIEIAQNPGW